MPWPRKWLNSTALPPEIVMSSLITPIPFSLELKKRQPCWSQKQNSGEPVYKLENVECPKKRYPTFGFLFLGHISINTLEAMLMLVLRTSLRRKKGTTYQYSLKPSDPTLTLSFVKGTGDVSALGRWLKGGKWHIIFWTFPDCTFAGNTEGSEYRITLKTIKPEFEPWFTKLVFWTRSFNGWA